MDFSVGGFLFMKKKTKLAIIIAILIILFVPIPTKLKEGGTVKYQAIL